MHMVGGLRCFHDFATTRSRTQHPDPDVVGIAGDIDNGQLPGFDPILRGAYYWSHTKNTNWC